MKINYLLIQLINVCEEFDIDSTTVAINGGEDYELLFTIAMEDFDKIKGNPNFSIIGHMTQESEGIHLITRADTKFSKGTWLGCYDRIKKKRHLKL
jgi:thiamine-monophosphate kinase